MPIQSQFETFMVIHILKKDVANIQLHDTTVFVRDVRHHIKLESHVVSLTKDVELQQLIE